MHDVLVVVELFKVTALITVNVTPLLTDKVAPEEVKTSDAAFSLVFTEIVPAVLLIVTALNVVDALPPID